jgi:hypothetical protein
MDYRNLPIREEIQKLFSEKMKIQPKLLDVINLGTVNMKTPVLVKCESFQDKQQITKSCYRLKGLDLKISIVNDLSGAQRMKRAELLQRKIQIREETSKATDEDSKTSEAVRNVTNGAEVEVCRGALVKVTRGLEVKVTSGAAVKVAKGEPTTNKSHGKLHKLDPNEGSAQRNEPGLGKSFLQLSKRAKVSQPNTDEKRKPKVKDILVKKIIFEKVKLERRNALDKIKNLLKAKCEQCWSRFNKESGSTDVNIHVCSQQNELLKLMVNYRKAEQQFVKDCNEVELEL